MGTRIKAWRVHQDGLEDGDRGKARRLRPENTAFIGSAALQ